MDTFTQKKTSLVRIIFACSFLLFSSSHSVKSNPITRTFTSDAWCVVGPNRGVGYALTDELGKRNITCRVLSRNTEKTKKLFKSRQTVAVVKGEATSTEDLVKVAKGCKYIFLGQSFPYGDNWEKNVHAMVDGAIAASKVTGATIIYPGRTYKYGSLSPLKEESVAQPNSHQGRVLKAVEEKLMNAANEKFEARIVRHTYPYGPAVGDGMLEDNFREIPKNKKRSWYQSNADFIWVGKSDISLQLTYTPDLARFIILYVTSLHQTAFDQINYAGHSFASMNEFATLVCKQSQEDDCEMYLHSEMKLRAAATFGTKSAKRALDVMYSFKEPILLDDSKQRNLFEEFEQTSVENAVSSTLRWYQTHRK